MRQPLELIKVANGCELTDELIDVPDCLAELEATFSVFRFRYSWGTIYEVAFTNHADSDDRKTCLRMMPAAHVYLETIETNTMGVGTNGVLREFTHRYVVGD